MGGAAADDPRNRRPSVATPAAEREGWHANQLDVHLLQPDVGGDELWRLGADRRHVHLHRPVLPGRRDAIDQPELPRHSLRHATAELADDTPRAPVRWRM